MTPQTKGVVHALLAVLAGLEIFQAGTKTRKLLNAAAAGYHAHAAFYHLVLEER